MSPLPPAPRRRGWPHVVALSLGLVAWHASGATLDPGGNEGAVARAMELAGSLLSPDLSTDALRQCLALALETVAIAVIGTAAGAIAGLVLALAASQRIACADGRPQSWRTRARLELVRAALDILRAIPDFAWALVALVFVGAGPVTGAIAIAISVTGLLGRTYSQLLDATPHTQTQAIDATGAPRIVVALWGHIPAAAAAMLSYTLLRLECSMRNASVIGIVGGGGIGAALFEELGFGHFDRVATLLMALLMLTGLTDLAAKAIAQSLRDRTGPGRRALFGIAAAAVLLSAITIGPSIAAAFDELARIDGAFVSASVDALLHPELRADALWDLVQGSAAVVGIAYLATGGAALAALFALWLVPRHHSLQRAPTAVRYTVVALRKSVDAVALLARGVPDVVWLLLLGVALGVGPLAAIVAIAIHSFGLLARLFAEAVDALPRARLSARALGSTRTNFAWGVWPEIAPTVKTHVSIQGESNLRASLIAGMVGAGGLGDAFHTSVTFWRLGDASVQALAMIVITVVVDRLARRATRSSARAPTVPATGGVHARSDDR